uniref:Uncharacterized protein n=1 Tax=Babesia duncani TaxID=323732 RepID=A0A385GNI8_9APIC|nr:hypothetical protein [Babesia duncani]
MIYFRISHTILLKFKTILYRSLIKLFGINKYKIKFISTLLNIFIFKKYININKLNYICLKNIFNHITFNINIFKKKNLLYFKKKYKLIKKNENKKFRKKNMQKL